MNEPLLRIVISQTWQIAALTIVVALIVRIVARNRPHLAHALWILVLIKCVTPPLWGHSHGVFSQIQALAAPGEVAAEIEDANLRVDTIEVDELANPEASLEMAEVAVSEAMISANDELLEPQLDAEPQRREVAEEAWDDQTQTDLASLRLGDSAFEISPFEPEAEIHAAEQPSLLASSRLPSLLFGGFLIGAIVTLMIMVKATVQPESWDTVGQTIIGVDEKTLSLVIRHTQSAHVEICKLIVQLRKADDHMISISSQIVKLTDDAQVQWLGTKCSLHSLENGTQWALLSKQRREVFTRELLGQKPEVLSAPKVMTISGQTATIQVGQTDTEDDTTIGARLEMTPHLLPDTKVFRLQHAVQIGKISADVLRPVESLVGSGQTLLLLLDAASESKEPEVSTSKYLLLITPEYVPIVEEK